jgi:hypothetical protein
VLLPSIYQKKQQQIKTVLLLFDKEKLNELERKTKLPMI